jgi:hypothetical protein
MKKSPAIYGVSEDLAPGAIDVMTGPGYGSIVEIAGQQYASWLPWHFDHCYNNELNRAGVLHCVKPTAERRHDRLCRRYRSLSLALAQTPGADRGLVVGYLAHESCQLTGELLISIGGRVARAFIGETIGVHREDWSIEDVAQNLAAVRNTDGFKLFPVASGYTDHLSYSLEFAHLKRPPG